MAKQLNGWNQWGQHVLSELEELNKTVGTLNTNFNKYQVKMAEQITMLKMKCGFYGLVAGMIPVAIMAAVMLLRATK